ncbi:winged helix DNA-binding protein [Leptolyngbya sp. 15MV]|nr:winged helix DNA-binding protein [Leptolyngbya sp. 15MV]
MRPITPRAKFSFLVHDVSRMRRTFFDQALKPLGITRAQWWALGNISRHADDGMIQTELANILDTGKVSVGGLIDRLEDAGLVYRQSDKVDRRVKRIFITEKGFELLDHISHVGDDLDKMLFANIREQDLVTASETLATVKHNIREALKAAPLAKPLPPKKRPAKA